MKVIAVYRPDGVSVIHPIYSKKKDTETEDEFLERIRLKAVRGINLESYPYDFIDDSSLPQDRDNRDKWRGSQGVGVSVDNSVVTKAEKIAQIENDIDAELDEVNPDMVKVAKLQRKLQKEDY